MYDIKYKYATDSYDIIGGYDWHESIVRVKDESELTSYLKESKRINDLINNNIIEDSSYNEELDITNEYKVILSINEVARELYNDKLGKLELDDLIKNMENIDDKVFVLDIDVKKRQEYLRGHQEFLNEEEVGYFKLPNCITDVLKKNQPDEITLYDTTDDSYGYHTKHIIGHDIKDKEFSCINESEILEGGRVDKFVFDKIKQNHYKINLNKSGIEFNEYDENTFYEFNIDIRLVEDKDYVINWDEFKGS